MANGNNRRARVTSAGESRPGTATLGSEEKKLLDRVFDTWMREFYHEGTEPWYDFVRQNYKAEVRFAAKVAKDQFSNLTFGGPQPDTSNEFGITRIQAGYFGWDDWDGFDASTAGDENDWLDSDTPTHANDNGTGEPLFVGSEVVHIVTGIGTFAPGDAIQNVRPRLNDKPRSTVWTEYAFRQTDQQVQPLASPIILTEGDEVQADVFPFADTENAPYLDGFTFITGSETRVDDPADMMASDTDESGEIVAS